MGMAAGDSGRQMRICRNAVRRDRSVGYLLRAEAGMNPAIVRRFGRRFYSHIARVVAKRRELRRAETGMLAIAARPGRCLDSRLPSVLPQRREICNPRMRVRIAILAGSSRRLALITGVNKRRKNKKRRKKQTRQRGLKQTNRGIVAG